MLNFARFRVAPLSRYVYLYTHRYLLCKVLILHVCKRKRERGKEKERVLHTYMNHKQVESSREYYPHSYCSCGFCCCLLYRYFKANCVGKTKRNHVLSRCLCWLFRKGIFRILFLFYLPATVFYTAFFVRISRGLFRSAQVLYFFVSPQ